MTFPSLRDIAAVFPCNPPLKVMRITQGFGENLVTFYKDIGLAGHTGWDLKAGTGTETYSTITGTCVYAGTDDFAGNILFLETKKEPIDDVMVVLQTAYFHLSKFLVRANQEVTVGQKVALTGNSGRFTTAPHLHYGHRLLYGPARIWKENGYRGYEDPTPFISASAIEELPVDRRYGKPRQFLKEKAFAFSPFTRRAFGRLPNAREINAICYGNGWTRQHVIDPAMFTVWTEMTYDQYRDRISSMIHANEGANVLDSTEGV